MALIAPRPVAPNQLESWCASGRLFAILDACDQPAVPAHCRALGDQRARSLYRGRADENLWAIAPYLVHVASPTLRWIRTVLWNEPWGVFAVSSGSFDELYGHFRQFLVVQAPTREAWYFRYYDPRVLTRYLASCLKPELERIFGPVSAFALGREHGCEVFVRPGLTATPVGA